MLRLFLTVYASNVYLYIAAKTPLQNMYVAAFHSLDLTLPLCIGCRNMCNSEYPIHHEHSYIVFYLQYHCYRV